MDIEKMRSEVGGILRMRWPSSPHLEDMEQEALIEYAHTGNLKAGIRAARRYHYHAVERGLAVGEVTYYHIDLAGLSHLIEQGYIAGVARTPEHALIQKEDGAIARYVLLNLLYTPTTTLAAMIGLNRRTVMRYKVKIREVLGLPSDAGLYITPAPG